MTKTSEEGPYSPEVEVDNLEENLFTNVVSKLPYANAMRRFADDQRLERLRNCHDVTTIYRRCMDHRRDVIEKKKDPTEFIDMELTSQGKRMATFFHWRESVPGEEYIPQARSRDDPPPSCAKEAHSMWACRGIALACAKYVNDMKDCFEEIPKDAIFDVHETAYERRYESREALKEASRHIPCVVQQQRVGQCVNQGATALARRKEQYDREDAAKSLS